MKLGVVLAGLPILIIILGHDSLCVLDVVFVDHVFIGCGLDWVAVLVVARVVISVLVVLVAIVIVLPVWVELLVGSVSSSVLVLLIPTGVVLVF